MSKIIILRGLPGSGKSTFAKQWVSEDPKHRIRVNLDDIRTTLGTPKKYFNRERELFTINIQLEIIKNAITKGYSIIVDNTNFYNKSIKRILNLFTPEVNYNVEYKLINTSLEECIRRDSLRENSVGEEVIRNFYNNNKEKYNLS